MVIFEGYIAYINFKRNKLFKSRRLSSKISTDRLIRPFLNLDLKLDYFNGSGVGISPFELFQLGNHIEKFTLIDFIPRDGNNLFVFMSCHSYTYYLPMYCKYLQAYDMILCYFGNNFLYKRTSVNAE